MKSQIDCIVLIDDDQPINVYHETLIKKTDIVGHIKTTNSAKEALAYFDNFQKQNLPKPNIVFLDINMPETSGWGFIEEFRQLDNAIRENVTIYMVTTSVNPADMDRAKNTEEIIDLIPKPLSADILNKIFTTYLNNH